MTRSVKNKRAEFLIFLCWLAYTSAYIGRFNYNASMVDILSQLNVTKEAAGTVSSFFFFSYGVGQIVNAFLSKRYNTKYSVAVSLAASSVINLAMTFCGGIGNMKYLWFLNGAFQSILWSSLIKTLSENIEDRKLPKAILILSTTVASGTFFAYGIAALFSALHLKWTTIFYVASAVVGFAALLWFFGIGTLKGEETASAEVKTKSRGKLSLTPALIFSFIVIFISAIANGFIKDGVTTWVPSILKEEFGVKSSLSIIVTLILPLIAIFGSTIVTALRRKQKNENILNGLFFLATVILVGAILVTLGLKLLPLSLALFAGVSCMMSSVNNVMTSVIPLYSRDNVDSGFMAGLLNTFCYVGSTLSTSLLGRIADKSGWIDVLVCILIFALTAFVMCVLASVFARKGGALTSGSMEK